MVLAFKHVDLGHARPVLYHCAELQSQLPHYYLCVCVFSLLLVIESKAPHTPVPPKLHMFYSPPFFVSHAQRAVIRV